jgi:hypothetical protein
VQKTTRRVPIRIPDLNSYEDILDVRTQYHLLDKEPAVLEVQLENEHSYSVAIVGVLLNAYRHFDGLALVHISNCSKGLRYIIEASGYGRYFLFEGLPAQYKLGDLSVTAAMEE